MTTYQEVWRVPSVESHDYPELCVDDGRVTGSITAGCTRLPLWAVIHTALSEGWGAVERGWHAGEYGLTSTSLGTFLYCLLEQRGEFGRLLCILADAERREYHDLPWWDRKTQRSRVLRQLKRCVAALEAIQ